MVKKSTKEEDVSYAFVNNRRIEQSVSTSYKYAYDAYGA